MTDVSQGVMRALAGTVLSELAAVKSITHPGENGRAREMILRTFLRAFVPPAFGVDTGFVIDAHGVLSRQIDIVIYRTGYHPVFEIGGVKHFMIESVAAVIENKAQITSTAVLEQALANVRSVKDLDRSGGGRNYVVADFHVRGPDVTEDPARFAVWSAIICQEVVSLATFADVLRADLASHPRSAWLDCFCAVHDFTTIYLAEVDGVREHRRLVTEDLTLLGVMPAQVGESPLVEFARLLADRLRSAPVIDFDPSRYFPSAMKHKPLVKLTGLGTSKVVPGPDSGGSAE